MKRAVALLRHTYRVVFDDGSWRIHKRHYGAVMPKTTIVAECSTEQQAESIVRKLLEDENGEGK